MLRIIYMKKTELRSIYTKIEKLKWEVTAKNFKVDYDSTPEYKQATSLVLEYCRAAGKSPKVLYYNRDAPLEADRREFASKAIDSYIFWKHTHNNAPYMYYLKYTMFVDDPKALAKSEENMKWRRIREAKKKNVVSGSI